MTIRSSAPSVENKFLQEHVSRLTTSFRHWTGKDLVDTALSNYEQARVLFEAPFVVLSHNTAAEPILNYANRAGLELFELTWDELTTLPSRRTAERLHQDERARLLARVTHQGYIDDYAGIRISKTGRRFMIEQATIWNLFDESGAAYGQAATFSRWRYLD